MSDLGTPAKYAGGDYLRNGKVHHGDIRWGTLVFVLGWLFGGMFAGLLLGVLIQPTQEAFLAALGACVGILFMAIRANRFLSTYGVWSGACPHCAASIAVAPPATVPAVFDCPKCKGRALIDREQHQFRVHRADDRSAA
jgi:hypothetical protein